jgi:sugar O-acyltransferase (sialic acid O-acetyltransferase NeuD family)
MKRLAIIGSGDLAKQIAHHAKNDGHYLPVFFFDDFLDKETIRHGLPVKGTINDIMECYIDGLFDVLMIGIGYKHMNSRKDLFNKFYRFIPFGKIIHSSCYVDCSSTIGDGSFLYPGCVIDLNVSIRENTILYTNCCISHDSNIGSHSIFSPAVNIAGFVTVGDCVNLGINTTVIDNISICDYVITGAGTVIVKNIENRGVYLGCPSRFLRP